jgi:sugar/nucleoside kinase (ribokinase family)
MTRHVLCAGLVVADHLTSPIDRMPGSGELVLAEELVLHAGGGAANAAIDLAKLDIPVQICGKVGDDAFGEFAGALLKRHGVDTRYLVTDPERATSQTLIVNVRGEDRRFIHSVGANAGFTIEDLDRAIENPPAVFYLGYLFILPALDVTAFADRLRRLQAAGTFVAVDVACPGKADYLPALRAVLPHVDLFHVNSDEAALILGEREDPLRQARELHQLGARRVVVTLGEKGAIALSDRQRLRLGAFSVPYVDGSGGGDAFVAGYLAAHFEGRDELGCLAAASALGASAVRAVGTTTSTFTRAELEAFLSKHTLAQEPIPA